MSPVETTFFYLALVICLTLSVISVFPKGLTQRVYLSLTVLALIFEGAAIGIRWSNTGHPPFAHIAFPIAAITMLYGLSFDTTAKPVTISEQSLWVDFHALFAWIAYGFYTFSFICALGILFKRPWAEAGEQALYRWLLWGFLAQTIMFVLGSYYSVRLYGTWWVWDTVEYLFVVSWFLYAIPIHGRILYGWGDRRLAGLTVLAMAGTIILYWGLVYFPWTTYHVFDTELVVHG
jgi:ABC-type transport system involved in cytochrome c biogenesis permease subunit